MCVYMFLYMYTYIYLLIHNIILRYKCASYILKLHYAPVITHRCELNPHRGATEAEVRESIYRPGYSRFGVYDECHV